MRREMSGDWMWLALVFMVGVVIGRLVIPFFEPHGEYLVEISNHPHQRQCTLSIGGTEGNVFRKEELDEIDDLKCMERRAFGNTVIQCRCDPD
jgi:hypothetical protein